jgi:hypothetical protein
MEASKKQSLFCLDHEESAGMSDGLFTILPERAFTLARAYGAKASETASGFIDTEPLITSPEELKSIPRLSEQPLVAAQLSDIGRLSKRENVWLNATAPYSLLAELSSRKMPAWLIRFPDDVHAALRAITQGIQEYIASAFASGALIVSISDHHAQRELLGEKRFRIFAAEYQRRLLANLSESGLRGVVHLCPYSFEPLCEYGLADVRVIAPEKSDYRQTLLEMSRKTSSLVILGHQCPHTRSSASVYQIEIKPSIIMTLSGCCILDCCM